MIRCVKRSEKAGYKRVRDYAVLGITGPGLFNEMDLACVYSRTSMPAAFYGKENLQWKSGYDMIHKTHSKEEAYGYSDRGSQPHR
jgi:hypothetical protein